MSDARQTSSLIQTVVQRGVALLTPFKAIVTGVAAGLTTVRLPEADDGNDEEYARLVGFAYATDDEVLVINVNGTPFVLGKIQRSAPGLYTLDAALTVQDDLTVLNDTILGNSDADETTIKGHVIHDGTLPGFAFGAGAGTGGSLAFAAAGSDCSFRVGLTTGNAPAANTLFTTTFADAWTSAEYEVTFSAADADAATHIARVFVDQANQTTTAFTFVAATALSANTSYRWNFHVKGGT